MKVPQCISIVDAGGHLLTFARMDGAFALSVDTSLMKPMTAAPYGIPTDDIATGTKVTVHSIPGKRPIGLRRKSAVFGGDGLLCGGAPKGIRTSDTEIIVFLFTRMIGANSAHLCGVGKGGSAPPLPSIPATRRSAYWGRHSAHP
jgi:hypothetical protein